MRGRGIRQKSPKNTRPRKTTMEKQETPNIAELIGLAVQAALTAAGVTQGTPYQTTEHKARRRAAPSASVVDPPANVIDWDHESKRCPKCGTNKLFREFGPRPRRGRIYVQSYCTKCRGVDYSKRPRKYRVK